MTQLFESWLRKGLGRSILHLKSHDDTPFEAAIKKAITHNLAYDWQCEDLRGQYHFDLIQASRRPALYIDYLTQSLLNPEEGMSLGQMFDLAVLLAPKFPAVRKAVYEAFAKGALKNDFTGADQIVTLDGLNGFEFAVSHMSGLDFEKEGWELRSCIDELAELLGKEEVWRAISGLNPTRNPRYQELLAAVKAQDEELETHWKTKKTPSVPEFPSLTEILNHIDRGMPSWRSMMRRWSKHCENQVEILEATRLIEIEVDPERLIKLLWLFCKKPFPGDPDRLIALAHSTDDTLAESAMWALEHTASPKIRDLALKFTDANRIVQRVPSLLIRNYQPGDENLVTDLLSQTLEDFEYHTMNINAGEFFEAHPELDCSEAMAHVYENNPCSMCRWSAMNLWVKSRKILSATILEEALWDCDLDTRKLVSETESPAHD